VKTVNGTQHYTLEEYWHLKGTKTGENKYHAVKTMVDGITFDSKAESRRYDELKLLLNAGLLKGFACQPSFILPGGIRYRPDFIVCDASGLIWAEDVKGIRTQAFALKQRLWAVSYPWLELRIVD